MSEQEAMEMEKENQEDLGSLETGKISVTADDMLPIIKKWLYSEHDIFLRELVSNAMDAITKHKHLSLAGEASQKDVDYKVEIAINESGKTLHIKDNGIGMSADEIKKYITQLAFSGASEFFEKYKGGDEKSQIIGHFGLGFYSSFMVADKVEIKSLSFREDAQAVHWICDGSTNYTLGDAEGLVSHGTEIILHINEDSEEFLKEAELRSVLSCYSEFLPVSIHLNGTHINTQKAIWVEQPTSLSDEDYQKFYDHVFPMHEKALFHLHFNLDSPFQVRGILYFHKIKQNFDSFKGRIKLYCNQVFVSDSIEEIFPSYFFMLQGVIDCPDIPLNVSRSALQGDPLIKKISQHIVKKIADKLKDFFKKDREKFETFWEDINPFVKFGVLQDERFFERVHEFVIYRSTLDGKYSTIKDYLERNKEKHENKIYYVSDEEGQLAYLELFKKEGREALIMDEVLDSHYIQHLEIKNPDWKFQRIDSDLDESLVDKDKESKIVDQDSRTREDSIKDAFIKALGNEKVAVRVEHLKSEDVSGMILFSEQMRRFQEMSSVAMQKAPEFLEEHTLVVNAENPIVQKVAQMSESMKTEEVTLVCQHVYDLALISQKNFDAKKMGEFVERSNKILHLLAS